MYEFYNQQASLLLLFMYMTFQNKIFNNPHIGMQGNFDPFASQPAFPAAISSNVDLFDVPNTGLPSETKASNTVNNESFDPFAAIPINSFDGSDPFGTFAYAKQVTTEPAQNYTNTTKNNVDEDSAFGDFTSHTEQTLPEPSQHSSKGSLNNLKTPLTVSAPAARKDNFQVKSGVWADCLSRGLIDLNISAREFLYIQLLS